LPEGAHENFDDDTYHQRELGVASKSALDKVHRSPAHYKAWVDGEVVDEEREALAFGKAFHAAVLEPAKWAARYAVQPYFGDGRTKEAKAAKAEWLARNAGKTPIAPADYAKIEAMAASVFSHPLASKLVTGGRAELTLRWVDEATGLPCKGRVDYLTMGDRVMVDLKSAVSADFKEFSRSCAKYGYHRQNAFYMDGARALGMPTENFLFVVVEKDPPYAVAVYSIRESDVQKGRDSIRDDLETLAGCMRSGVWSAYPVRIQELDLPPWAA
jgi:hypothetical protein